jgi:hypothetical protein
MKLYQVVKREENPTISVKEAARALQDGEGVIFVVNKDEDRMLGVILYDGEEDRYGFTQDLMSIGYDGLYNTRDSIEDCMKSVESDCSCSVIYQFTSKCE